MPWITFDIDTKTGKMIVEQGDIEGPACGDVAAMVEKFVGAASVDEVTPDYHRAPKQTVKLTN